MKNNKKLLLSLAISTALYGTAGFAADDEEEDNVIIVTAQKRSERITEVPISISVFPEEAIDQTGIQELRELAEYIPNVSINQGTDFNSAILIRGVGAASRNIGFDSRVGVYLDGVYLGQGPAVNQDLVDLERVEVLRGPQGTLFGKNTVAGAISLISKKPHHEFEGSASINASNFNGLELRATVNVPLSDKFLAKFAVSSRERDGYIENIFSQDQVPTDVFLGPAVGFLPLSIAIPVVFSPGFEAAGFPPLPQTGIGPNSPPAGTDLNNQDTQSWRAQLRYEASDNLDFNLALDGLDSSRDPILAINQTDTFGSIVDQFAPGPDQVSWSHQGGETRDISGVSFEVVYETDNDFTFKSITSNRETEIHYENDTDYTPIDFLHIEYTDIYDQTTQEFQIISPDDVNFKYVLGLYLYDQDSDTTRDAVNGNAAFFFGNFPGTVVRNNGVVGTTSTAFYVSGSLDFAETWKLGFGFRYTDEDKDVVWNLDGSFSGAFAIGSTPTGGFVDTRNDSEITPTISLNHTLDGGANVYAKFSTGFKSGGFNLDFIRQSDLDLGIEFDKETVESIEFGIKGTALDNRLTYSAAYFDAEFDDYQVNQFFDLGFDPVTGAQLTSIRITNAAVVETDGFEFEATFKMTDDLTINGSIGTLDAIFASFPGGTTARDPVTGATLAVDAAGNNLPGAADFNASFGIQYYSRIESFDADLLMRLDITHTGDYFTSIENETTRELIGTAALVGALDPASFGQTATIPFGHVDAYTLVNARFGLIDAQGDWDVYLWGRNLTDEDQYVNSIREFFGTLAFTPQTPRTYGIEATYHF